MPPMYIFLVFALTLHLTSSFHASTCTLDGKPTATQAEKRSRTLRKTRDLVGARACAALAWDLSRSPKTLKSLQDVQLEFLDSPVQRSQAPQDEHFPAVWQELMRIMVKKNLMVMPEMDALNNRWEVYLLHGQLACMEEKTASATRSLHLAMQMRESSAVHRLLARISLGRGDALGALRSATAVRTSRGGANKIDSNVALLLQLQAHYALSTGGGGLNAASLGVGTDGRAITPPSAWDSEEEEEKGVVSSSGPGLSDLPDAEEVWEGVRELLATQFRSLGLPLPKGDPLTLDSTPSFLLAPPPPSPAIASGSSGSSGSGSGSGSSGSDSPSWGYLEGTPDAAASWAAKGYAVLRNLIPGPFFQALVRRHGVLFFPAPGQESLATIRTEGDEGQKRRLLWDEEVSLYVGTRLLPAVGAITGLRLANTYTCSIAYSVGGDLKPHVDREQNALSLTLNLGLDPSDAPDWPIWVSPASNHPVQGDNNVAGGWATPNLTLGTPVYLHPNDGMLYRGPRIVHYRYPLAHANRSMQVIFGFREVNPGHCNSN